MNERINALDGMRGYAVWLVFLVHHDSLFGSYLPMGSFASKISAFSYYVGHSGVDLFFMLSGYLIYGHLLARPTSISTFLVKRARRIYPTFLCVLLIYIALSFAFPSRSKLPGGLENIVYIGENLLLLPGIAAITPIITVAWSLSYEALFYLTIPFIVDGLNLRKWKPRQRVIFFVGLFVAQAVAFQIGFVPHIRLAMFTYGILLCDITALREIRMPPEGTAAGLYLIVFLSLGLLSLHEGRLVFLPQSLLWSLGFGISSFMLAYHSIRSAGAISQLLSLSPVRWMGRISYSFFLIHGLMLNGMHAVLVWAGFRPPVIAFPAVFLVNMGVSIFAAYGLYVLIERPFSSPHLAD